MVVSRYGILTLDALYIMDKILAAVVALSKFGWIVDNVGGDGASENRSALKQLGTISARELLKDVIVDLYEENDEILDKLPLDLTIGFRHPIHPDVIVFICADMPHLIKKIVNAFDRSSKPRNKTSLCFRGKPISLGIIQKMWEVSSDGNGSSAINIFRKFTRDHFEKNAFNQIRVYLAAQITSLTTIDLLTTDELLDKCKFTKEDMLPTIDVVKKLDQMIDIMNAKGFHRNKKKEGEVINSPKHRHLKELLNLLVLFTEWKREAGSLKFHFITRESYEDMSWMVFAVVGVASTYLKTDSSRRFDQGRSGSDCCEHHFANIRMRYQSASLIDCEVGTANAQTSRSNTFTTKSNASTAGTRKETRNELLAPIIRK